MNDTVYGTDQWGVHVNMFGPVPEDFWGLIGRITAVSALVEQRLHDLYCTLARVAQDVHAGAPGTFLIRELRGHVQAVPLDQHDQVQAFLTDAEAALVQRHEIVHSLWPHSGSPTVRGWRGVPLRKRRDPEQAAEWTSVHAGDLPVVLGDLLDVARRCADLLASAPQRS
jgi:hypothetical protein